MPGHRHNRLSKINLFRSLKLLLEFYGNLIKIVSLVVHPMLVCAYVSSFG